MPRGRRSEKAPRPPSHAVSFTGSWKRTPGGARDTGPCRRETSLPFPAWETFYVIVGSSAGGLTGLMFVVMALVADFPSTERQIEAFGTPTVMHFGAVLLLSAILSAPWPSISGARLALGVFGAAGVVYMF